MKKTFTLKKSKNPQAGVISSLGLGLMILVVFAVIGLTIWIVAGNNKPSLIYTPPKVTADTPISAGKTTKEIIQDVRVLDAGFKRTEIYKASSEKALADKQYTGDGDASSVDQQQDDLSEMQTVFIKESNRRIQAMTKAKPLLKRLTSSQRPAVEQLLEGEISILNNLKQQVVKVTDVNELDPQQQELNGEYNNYLLGLAQVNLLAWANDQATLNEKFNKVGGKFQERADTASNNGQSIAAMQTILNGYQANKLTARSATNGVIRVVPTIRPGEQESNRSVLKTYVTQLTTANNELSKANVAAKKLAAQVQSFDQ